MSGDMLLQFGDKMSIRLSAIVHEQALNGLFERT